MGKSKSLLLTVTVYLIGLIISAIIYIYLRDSYDALFSILIADIVFTTIVFTCSILINNSSLYDPYWSVIPMIIVIVWYIDVATASWQNILLIIGVFVWGVRLTYNWIRDLKGYSHEDFRYVDFRKKFGKLYWAISFLGIHMFPTLIVLLSMYPIYYVFTNTVSNNAFIILGVIIMITGALISYISDGQVRKHKKNGNKTALADGLWKYSRHPNYFGEVLFWIGIYVSSISAGLNIYTTLGMIGMLLLFNLYSVPKMEQKLLHNKPNYQFIIDTVPRFMFWKPKK